MQEVLVGIDIGGTKCAVCISTPDGKIIDKISFPTDEPAGPEQAITNIIESVQLLLNKSGKKAKAIGISCGSPLDPYEGIILSPPNLSSWKNIPIVKIIQDKFSAPTFLDNDANAGALAEFVFGAGRGFKNIVFITFGTGCGAGLILDGKIYRGTNCFAGEIGHMRLAEDGPIGYHKAGSMEGFCSGGGLAQLAQQMRLNFSKSSLSANPSAKEVGEAAKQGDELARIILEKSGHYLGKGLAIICDIINPQVIVIGSIFVRCEEFIRPAMQKALEQEALSYTRNVCKVVPAELGEAVGDLAAISIAKYALLDQ